MTETMTALLAACVAAGGSGGEVLGPAHYAEAVAAYEATETLTTVTADGHATTLWDAPDGHWMVVSRAPGASEIIVLCRGRRPVVDITL